MEPTRHISHPQPDGLSTDPTWVRAGEWLAAGVSDNDPVDVTIIGVPAHRTSLSPTGADRTPTAIRDALWRFSTYAATRQGDVHSASVLLSRQATYQFVLVEPPHQFSRRRTKRLIDGRGCCGGGGIETAGCGEPVP